MNELSWLQHRDVIWTFYRAANAYGSMMKKKFVCGNLLLNPVEIQILEHILIYSREQHNMKWYANQIGISPSSLTHYINDMEKRGIIEKYHTSSNKKNVILQISREGTEAYQCYVSQVEAFFQAICKELDGLTPDAEEKLVSVLNFWANGHIADVAHHQEELIRITGR